MTPQREEAERFLRLAKRDQAAFAALLNAAAVDPAVAPSIDEHGLRCLTPYAVEFRYDDEAIHLISGGAAGRLVGSLLAWAEEEIASHPDSR